MRTLCLVSASAVSLLSAQAASAQTSIPAEVLIVLAKQDPGTVDAELSQVPALRRAPFNAFRSMRVLSRPRVTLRVGTPTDVELPNGRRLRLNLQQVGSDGRYRIEVSINRPEQNDYLPLLRVVASPGDPFFVAGQSHQGGTLVIGIRAGERPAGAAPARTQVIRLKLPTELANCEPVRLRAEHEAICRFPVVVDRPASRMVRDGSRGTLRRHGS